MRAVPGHGGGSSTATRRARFEALFVEVYEPLQRYVRRRAAAADADDVVADALLVAWRRLDDVPSEAAVAWMYGVARNCLANHRRSSTRADRLTLRVAGAVHVESQERHGVEDPALDQALSRLAEPDREVLRLWAWEQLTPAEIAIVLGTTPNAVSIRLHRAKQRLGAALDDGRKNQTAGGHSPHEHREEER